MRDQVQRAAYSDATNMIPRAEDNVADFSEVGGAMKLYRRLFRKRQDTMNLLRQLLQIAKATQRHRGMSMTLLGGNPTFECDFSLLQKELDHRIAYLNRFFEGIDIDFSLADQQNLRNAWLTIRSDWQDDDVVDNFELHSHFIEQIHAMIVSTARHVEMPVSQIVQDARLGTQPTRDNAANTPESAAYSVKRLVQSSAVVSIVDEKDRHPKYFQQIELLEFIGRHIPAMVEQIARVRGLASYVAAKGHCEPHIRGKIRFAINSVRSMGERLRQQALRLHDILGSSFSAIDVIQTYELKFTHLIDIVQGQVLSEAAVTADGNQLFQLATEIIDAYLLVVEEGFNTFSQWQDQDQERWLRSSLGEL